MNYRAKAALFRENAEEIRVRTEELKAEETKEIFLRLANDYEGLASTYDAMAELAGKY